ncbi:hypothetical protein MBLNU13_g10179t3 [Cladosporium sp. NU13]
MQVYHYCHAHCACPASQQRIRALNLRRQLQQQQRGAPYQPHPRAPGGQPLPPQTPPIDRYPTVAHIQAHQQRFTVPHVRPNYYAMSLQANAGGAFTQELQRDHDMGRSHTPAFTAQTPLAHPHAGHSSPRQSFFTDEYYNYRAEEATLYNPRQHVQPQDTIRPSARSLDLSRAPMYLPSMANNGTAGQTVTSCVDVPIMPLVHTNVDTKMFEPIEPEHWQRASLDFSGGNVHDAFATSPSSIADTSCGPHTPHDNSGFPEATLRRISHDLSSSFDISGTDMFEEHGPDMKFPSFSDVGSASSTQFANQTSEYAGLPFPGGSFGGFRDLPLNGGPFRDIDGLPPIFPGIAPNSPGAPDAEEHDSSAISCPAPKTKRRHSSERERETALRERRDQYLLDRREEGYTYKDIKVMGNFSEAESTLRGRVRVLTKDRSERVRKPVWTESDIRLLRRGVAHAKRLRAQGAYNRIRSSKLPWKYIAQYMEEHGSSYSFAPATCAKKWDELR